MDARPVRHVVSMIRVSTPGQATDEKMGLKRQRNDIKTFCAVYCLKVVEEFQIVMSGSDVQRGREFNRMLEMLKRPDIAGVVVPSLDRLLRGGRLSVMSVFKNFEDYGKRLFCDVRGTTLNGGGGLDLLDGNDQMMISFKLQQAGMERNLILHRTMNSKNELRQDPTASVEKLPNGVKHDRPNPRINSAKFEYTEFATTKVREAFRRVLRGDTLFNITEELGFESIPALRYILKNEWWIGYRVRGHKIKDRVWDSESEKWAGGKRVEHDNIVKVRTNLADNPLVSPEEFERVQEILATNRKTWTQRKNRDNNFLASGLLYCKCGAKMYHRKGIRGRSDVYVCANRHTGKMKCNEPVFKQKLVDEEIGLKAVLYLTDENFVQARIKETQSEDHATQARVAVRVAEKSVEEIEKRRKRILAAIENTDDGSLADRLKELNRELVRAKARVRLAQAEISDIGPEDTKAMALQIKHDFAGFMDMPIDRKKALLARYIERLTPSRHEVTDDVQMVFKVKAEYSTIEDFTDEPVKAKAPPKGRNSGESWLPDGEKIRPSRANQNKSSYSRTSWTRGSIT